MDRPRRRLATRLTVAASILLAVVLGLVIGRLTAPPAAAASTSEATSVTKAELTSSTTSAPGNPDGPERQHPSDPQPHSLRVRLAVIGDSILSPDGNWDGAQEEITARLGGEGGIDLAFYSGIGGTRLVDHPFLDAALESQPDVLVTDLLVNDGFQIGLDRETMAEALAKIDEIVARAEESGVGCIRWITYRRDFPNNPRMESALRTLMDRVEEIAASSPHVGVLDFGAVVDAEQDYVSIDRIHYTHEANVDLAERLAAAVRSDAC